MLLTLAARIESKARAAIPEIVYYLGQNSDSYHANQDDQGPEEDFLKPTQEDSRSTLVNPGRCKKHQDRHKPNRGPAYWPDPLRMISRKLWGSRAAPPMSAPSISGQAMSSVALLGFTLPPYWMRMREAVSAP